jgi:epoxyqueuosine reductase
MNPTDQTHLVKQAALSAGFDYCGIARAEPLDQDARRLENWITKGFHGSMSYMEKYFELRVNPCLLVPGAKSVITLLLNYFPEQKQPVGTPEIAKYAFGRDYHEVIKSKLNVMLQQLKDRVGNIQGRGFVDSAPVLERAWAERSGLGWVGKNANLIVKGGGSFFFIATLIVDLALQYDDPYAADFCGSCRKCLDSCPTGAILEDRVVDGSKCISYFTIELKDLLLPEAMKGQFQDWLFGCDTCQDVCPWNRFSKPTTDVELKPLAEILNFSTSDWEELTEETFKRVFKHSALSRAKYSGIKRNLQFIRSAKPGKGGQ